MLAVFLRIDWIMYADCGDTDVHIKLIISLRITNFSEIISILWRAFTFFYIVSYFGVSLTALGERFYQQGKRIKHSKADLCFSSNKSKQSYL